MRPSESERHFFHGQLSSLNQFQLSFGAAGGSHDDQTYFVSRQVLNLVAGMAWMGAVM